MYLRLSTVRRGSKVYRYAQLVESFRRPGGTPTNRVLANLGALDDVAIGNLRLALAASKVGRAVVVPREATVQGPRAVVEASLRYLDVAALLRVWGDLGLQDLLRRVLPAVERTAPSADVITALVLQRCVAPGSKLAAERWFPTTALPELMAIAPGQFNNSRLHRCLADLEKADADLQGSLAPTLKSSEGAFTWLAIDATDTWFEGRGPPLAHKARDKEGVYRRRLGLVILCDQRGYPLRWHTLSGRYHDPTALADMAREAASLSWTRNLPIVMDRAMGHAGATERLHTAGLHYVTALPDSELESSGAPLPWATLDALQATPDADLPARLTHAGFTPSDDGRFILDLGVFAKAHSAAAGRESVAAAAIRLLGEIEEGPTMDAVSARTGMTKTHLQRHAHLRPLTPKVRHRVQTEDCGRLGLRDLVRVAQAEPGAQASLLDAMLASASGIRRSARRRRRATYPCRAVLVFSPERFRADRRADEEHLVEIDERIADINRRLSHRSNRRTDGSALAEVEFLLRKYGLRGVFTPEINGRGPDRRVGLVKDEAAWARRRRGDGISVILAHPEVQASADVLIRQYFAKDVIEKDFQLIKSCIEIRPIHHRTDHKVRAHVTICVLALLLLRALDARLAGTGLSALACIEALEPTRLNHVQQGRSAFYTVTRPDSKATRILDHLALPELAQDSRIGEVITER